MLQKMLSFAWLLALAGAVWIAGPVLAAGPGRGGGHAGGGHAGGGHAGGGHFAGARIGGFRGGFYLGGFGYSSGYRPYSGYRNSSLYPRSYGYPYYGYYTYPYYGSNDYATDYPYDPAPPLVPDVPEPDGSVDSPADADNGAHLTVRVPADAEVWLGGAKTTSTGRVREYLSPPLTSGSRYYYEVRARWTENGREVTQTQKVAVTAGAHVSVRFPNSSAKQQKGTGD